MDVETYERDIMQPEDWPYQVVNRPVPGARDAAGTLRSGQRSGGGGGVGAGASPVLVNPLPPPSQLVGQGVTVNNNTSSTTSSSSRSSNDAMDKWNRCKYQCCLCDLITLDQRQMRTHIAGNIQKFTKNQENHVHLALLLVRSLRRRSFDFEKPGKEVF